MKMIFDYDDMVTIAKIEGTSLQVRKQEISDFLIKTQIMEDKLVKSAVMNNGRIYPQDGIKIIENAVILSNIKHVDVITLEKKDRIIYLYPIGITMKVREEIWKFLNSKFNN